MSEPTEDQYAQWKDACHTFIFSQPTTKLRKLYVILIHWRIRDWWWSIWCGKSVLSFDDWAKWNGPPPCRIVRLWRREPDG